jgi:hypothetical protein
VFAIGTDVQKRKRSCKRPASERLLSCPLNNMKPNVLPFAALIFAAAVAGWVWMPTAVSMQKVLVVPNANCLVPTIPAAARYKGSKYTTGTGTRLRISNGGGTHMLFCTCTE